MEERNYSEMTDEELMKEQKDLKAFSIINAVLIGFLVGIIFVSVTFGSLNMVMIIPLFLIYKIVNDPKNKKVKELEIILKQRNLK